MVHEARGAVEETPIVAQPNAGQPITKPHGVEYDADPEAFVADLVRMIEAGASVVGGCCGTDDQFIRLARARIPAVSAVRG